MKLKIFSLYIATVLSGLISSFLVIGLAWNEFGVKATKVILSMSSHAIYQNDARELEYGLMLVEYLDEQDYKSIYQASCMLFLSNRNDLDLTMAENAAELKRFRKLKEDAEAEYLSLVDRDVCQ